MKIIWLTNYPIPFIARKVGLQETVNEGWLITLAQRLIEEKTEVIFCSVLDSIKSDIYYHDDNVSFYGLKIKSTHSYQKELKNRFVDILKKEVPEVIHIMGTEFPHSYSLFEACKYLGIEKKCVVSIQGLISKIAKAYDIGIEEKQKKRRLLWDLLIKDSVLINMSDFIQRGMYEERLLTQVSNVIGRTEWDCMCTRQMNPTVKYFKCNEILREVFYKKRWKYENTEKYSIIISQATYPIKGFHILLKAVVKLLHKYPNLKIYVASQTMYEKAFKRNRLLNSDYTNYIVKLIKDSNLQKNIIFLGKLTAEEMCNAYLKSNIFVSASTIENSSNSVGEAMLLGMPIISSYVGGVTSMLEHKKEGMFFPINEEYLLAAYIEYLFDNKEFAIKMGENARVRALKTHDIESNVKDVKRCYNEIIS